LPKFVHRKYASLVNIDVGTLLQIAQQKNAKTMKKNIQKKIFFHDMKLEPQVFFFTPNPGKFVKIRNLMEISHFKVEALIFVFYFIATDAT
jgi:hypothetical protein